MTRLVGGSLLACRGGQVSEAAAPAEPAEPTPSVPPGMAAAIAPPTRTMLARTIPRTSERLPVIGMGTWETFDVGSSAGERYPLKEVLRTFAGAGGRVIDSSPMYGNAEAVTGDLVAETGVPSPCFVATKVWTRGRAEGEAQIAESQRLLRAPIDLLQVHNLLDFEVQIKTLRRMKEEGKVRYIGVTHYVVSAFAELERVIREERLDFVQLPYSLAVRDAEERLLPAAADLGVAVLVNRPFDAGALFKKVRGVAVPQWAADLECSSWAQLFLKFIVAHPAVHCPLPATRKPEHMADNVKAGFGPLPDADQRRRLQGLVG